MKDKEFWIGLLFALVIPLAFIFSTIACVISFVRASIATAILMLIVSVVTMPSAILGIAALISVASDKRDEHRKKNSHSNGGDEE